MIDKRAFLIAKGLAKTGRGRFSREALAAIKAAEDAGTVFLTPGVATETVTVTTEGGETVKETRNVDIFAPHADPIRTGMLPFKDSAGKKHMVNATEVCQSCFMSMGWCYEPVQTFRLWSTGEVLTYADHK